MRMAKQLLRIAFAACLGLAWSGVSAASSFDASPVGDEQTLEERAGVAGGQQSIAVAEGQKTVVVSGQAGQTLKVVSLTGRPVMQVKIESPAQKVELNVQPGCYILKVGKVVRKVAIH